MNRIDACITCATVKGDFRPPGGVVYDTPQWMVVLRSNPVRFPCMPLILLKRHVEDIASLETEESSSLGQIMQSTARALSLALKPARIHFGIYAEAVQHIHVHVFPRMPGMPAGNIPNLWIGQWLDLLHALRLRTAYSPEEVTQHAEALRQAFRDLENIHLHA